MLLLCSTDTSISGEAASRVAAELARRVQGELTALEADTRDPTARLLAAARASGCDLLVLGYVARASVEGASLPGWQCRVVRDAPCPVMLVPAAGALRGGGVVFGHGVPELPHQAARVAGRLAGRLRAPLVITHVLPVGGAPENRPTGRRPSHHARGHAREAESAAGCALRVRHVEREARPPEQLSRAAVTHEASLVVIGGRGSGRRLLPHRRIAAHLPPGTRLPIVVAVGSAPR